MKDTIISLIKIVGFLSTTYLAFIGMIFAVMIAKKIVETATQSQTGEFLQFAFQNYWTLLVSAFFSLIFIAYEIKHNKNEKRRREEKKYSGSLIGKPL